MKCRCVNVQVHLSMSAVTFLFVTRVTACGLDSQCSSLLHWPASTQDHTIYYRTYMNFGGVGNDLAMLNIAAHTLGYVRMPNPGNTELGAGAHRHASHFLYLTDIQKTPKNTMSQHNAQLRFKTFWPLDSFPPKQLCNRLDRNIRVFL